MAKISAKNGILVIGGYRLSGFAGEYTIDAAQDVIDVTGFGDGWKNFIPGNYTGMMNVNFYWDKDANSVNAAMIGMAKKCVSILPEGYALGNPAFSIYSEQENFSPSGDPSAAIMLNNVRFLTSGVDGGPLPSVALAHATITDTTTGTGYDDPTGAAVTARCAGVLHVWTPTSTDTYVVKIQHSTLLGSGYADLITFTLNGTARNSEKVTVASGTINRYRRVVATRTGTGDSFGYTVTFWHSGGVI